MDRSTSPLTDPDELAALREAVERDLPRYLRELEALVNVDCGSYTKPGVDEVGRWTAGALAELGGEVETIPDARLGDTVVATFRGPGHGRVLVIGHLDTVFEPGTVAARPFRIEGGRAYGPGVSDMKAGLLAGIEALRALRTLAGDRPSPAASSATAASAATGASAGAWAATGGSANPAASAATGAVAGARAWLPLERLTFVANPDEEIGSPVSTPIIERLAPEHDVALVLEGGRANGDIVSSRKGNLSLTLTVRGRAAHAGVEPEKGRSAILEAAHKVVALHALNGRWPGVTCNVGAIRGGTRPNIVPDEAILEIDVRAVTREALEEADDAIAAIARSATVPDTIGRVEEQSRHWPMEKLPAAAELVDAALAIAGLLGFPLHDAATGGASDANTTAGLGIPSLDGLGPVGGLDHSPEEYVEVDSMGPRVTLLAGLLLAVGRRATA